MKRYKNIVVGSEFLITYQVEFKLLLISIDKSLVVANSRYQVAFVIFDRLVIDRGVPQGTVLGPT